ncbi:MAG: 1-acyl-sn-glycerol-3-phosphate acyltransferase [Ilumatobacter sp.]|jgi:1-acyl-sn-glycerol-3-phosphate acyltransferase
MPPNHSVMLALPHTTNFDGVLLVLVTRSIGLDASWMVKDLWVKPPFGWITKRVGAVPVDRRKSNGMVGQMVERFENLDSFHLMVPPEGTRGLTEHWKSGFYRIATTADVPVVPTSLDYRTRRAIFGPALKMTGERSVDMDGIRSYYEGLGGGAMARHPEKFGPVRLDDES